MSAESIEQPARKRRYGWTGLDPSECKKRWFSEDPHCECANCLPLHRREAKRRLHRTQRPNRSDEAWAAVERMLAKGWSIGAIAAAADVDPSGLSVDHGRQLRVGLRLGRVRAERLIAAEKMIPQRGRIASLTAQRQLRALARLGHSTRRLEPVAGVKWQTLHAIRAGIVKNTDAANANAIATAYGELSMTLGKCTTTRRHAEEHGWAPPLAWEGLDMADPKAKPAGTARPAPKRR